MARSGAERQATYEEGRLKELADALAEVEEMKARVAALQRERDRLEGFFGFAVKREEWAAAERLRASEAEREAEAADDETAPVASKIVVVRAPSFV